MATVTLSRPIDHANQRIETITIDEPTIGAIEAFENARKIGRPEVTCLLALLAVDTGLPIEALRKMRASDVRRVSDAIAPFVEQMTQEDAPGLTGEPTPPKSLMS